MDTFEPASPRPPVWRAPLDADRLADAARQRQCVATYIEVLESTSSTNDVCHEAAELGAAEGLVVFAEEQSAGRGQHGRHWSAPPRSSLLFSLLLRPPAPLGQPSFLVAWAACGLARLLRDEYGIGVSIKWPNDLIADGLKLCGILTERRRGTVVGIGINCSIKPDEFPADLRLPATTLEMLWGQPIDRTDLANQLLDELDALYSVAESQGVVYVDELWQEFAEAEPGSVVTVATRQGEIEGELVHLSPTTGALLRGQARPIAPEEIIRIQRTS